MKLNLKWCWNLSVEGSMLSMQSCMCWRSFFNILLHSFQTEIAVLQRECTKSGGTLFMEYHVLKRIRLGFIDVGCLYTKKCWTHILSALCLLYFGSIVAAFFEKCQTLQKTRLTKKTNCSLSIWCYPNLGKRRPELSAGVMK